MNKAEMNECIAVARKLRDEGKLHCHTPEDTEAEYLRYRRGQIAASERRRHLRRIDPCISAQNAEILALLRA